MKKLVADKIANDPRLAQAKQLILDLIAEHSSELAEVRDPDQELHQDYEKMLEEFGGYRGGSLYFPYLSSGAGNGPFVELADGSVKLDLITGIGVHGFGHCHPDLIAAGIDSTISDTVMQGNLQTNCESVDLSKTILDLANKNGQHYDHCFLSTSGAMANENALKIAFQKNFPADRILAFENCFCGRTIALMSRT